jgi:Mn-containing catalase
MMKEIKLLSDHIEDELEDAEDYATLANEYKMSEPDMAALFYKLSGEEMGHMEMLHKKVVELIEKYRREHGAPPVAMQAVYDHLHKRFIAKAEKVTNLQNMFRK